MESGRRGKREERRAKNALCQKRPGTLDVFKKQ